MLVEKLHKTISGDTDLDANIYLPDGNKQFPAVLISHGFLSAKDEFADLPENIAKQGYVVVTYDFSGHGKSTGDRGYVRGDTHLNDAERALKLLFDQVKTDINRVAVLGHSLGTCATTRLITETELGKKVKTAILLSPPRKLSDSVSNLELKAYKFAYNISWPILLLTGKQIHLPYKYSAKDIYVSKDAIRKAESLNFLQKTMPINNYGYMIATIDNEKYASKIQVPVLVGVAKNDKLVPNSGSKVVYDAIKTEKKWFEVDNSGHSMMADNSSAQVETEVLSWLNEKL